MLCHGRAIAQLMEAEHWRINREVLRPLIQNGQGLSQVGNGITRHEDAGLILRCYVELGTTREKLLIYCLDSAHRSCVM